MLGRLRRIFNGRLRELRLMYRLDFDLLTKTWKLTAIKERRRLIC